jgi:hypothetical protein
MPPFGGLVVGAVASRVCLSLPINDTAPCSNNIGDGTVSYIERSMESISFSIFYNGLRNTVIELKKDYKRRDGRKEGHNKSYGE